MPIELDRATQSARRINARSITARDRAGTEESFMYPHDPIVTSLRVNHRHNELLIEAGRSRQVALATSGRRPRLETIRRTIGGATIALGWWLHGHHDPDTERRESAGFPAYGGGR